MARSFATAALVVAAVCAGCRDGSGPSDGFVVSGPLENRTGAPIPPDARVVVVWGVSSGTPDYSYVFGEGSLSPDGTTFQVRFDQPPPGEALNNGALGVGLVVVTTNQSLRNGDDVADIPESDIIGVAGQHAVIYVGDRQQAAQFRAWVAEFATGLSVGVGVKVPGDFDKFEAASASSVVLTIDDLANIEIVNWT